MQKSQTERFVPAGPRLRAREQHAIRVERRAWNEALNQLRQARHSPDVADFDRRGRRYQPRFGRLPSEGTA